VAPLTPATTVAARTVTFKNSIEPEQFLAVARRKLDELGIVGEPGIPLIRKAKELESRAGRFSGSRAAGSSGSRSKSKG